MVAFSYRPILNILTYKKPLIKTSNNLENKALSYTYWRVQLVCKKVQVHSSLEPPLKYNQDQISLTNQGSLWPF